MATIQDIYDQLGLGPVGAMPPGLPPAPPVGPSYTPYDTSVVPGTAFGTPYPGGFPTPTDTGPVGPGHIPREPSAAPAPTGYGPQPRAALPGPLADPNAALFDTYRRLYDNAPAEQDPIAALLGDQTAGLPGFRAVPGPSRALAPQWAGQQGGGQYGAQGGMTHGERTLMDRHPAYGPAIARIRALDRLRAARGL